VKPGTTFTVPLAKRRIDVEETLLELAQQWLLGALCHAGAGAKTAAGYGCFKPADDKEAAPPCLRTIWTGALAAPQRTACETSVQLRLITPAFLGGSDQNAQNDHLRLTGIKAMLRFWWRAWHGNLTVEQLRDREAQCFGSIDCGTGLQVIPLITQDRLKLLPSGSDMGPGGSPLGYLGYGPISYDKQTKTNRTKVVALNADQHLHFRLVHRSQAELEEVLKSLWLLGALGGIGSRCRRGWGSLTLPSDLNTLGLPSLAACQSVERYRQTLEQGMEVLMASAARPDAGELPWTGLSKQFRVIFSKQTFTSWRDAMEDLGRKFQSFRAYDNRASSPARPKSKPGPDYHQTKHMINSAGSGQGTGSLPERAGFGLPYTQAYRSLQDKRADFTPSWFENGKEIEGRRASPLICKVCQLADGKFFWQVTFLPSQFLPKGAKVNGMAYMKKQFLGQLTNQPYDSPTSFGIIRKNKNLEDTLVYDFLNWLETGRVTYPPSSTPTAPTARSVPPPTPVAIKPINKGQTRTGTLKKEGPSWIARFDGDTREAAITNPGQIPKEAQENSAAEFYIEEASKKVGIRARFEKLIG
jgi:CRISPR/Cas system CMR-associated protein Cmr1 (group 7 of RAMP superfamily)